MENKRVDTSLNDKLEQLLRRTRRKEEDMVEFLMLLACDTDRYLQNLEANNKEGARYELVNMGVRLAKLKEMATE